MCVLDISTNLGSLWPHKVTSKTFHHCYTSNIGLKLELSSCYWTERKMRAVKTICIVHTYHILLKCKVQLKGPITRKMFLFDDVIMILRKHLARDTTGRRHKSRQCQYLFKKHTFCFICGHYSDVIMGAMTSQITGGLVVHSTVCSGADKKNIKAPRHWPLCGKFTGDRWVPRTNGH